MAVITNKSILSEAGSGGVTQATSRAFSTGSTLTTRTASIASSTNVAGARTASRSTLRSILLVRNPAPELTGPGWDPNSFSRDSGQSAGKTDLAKATSSSASNGSAAGPTASLNTPIASSSGGGSGGGTIDWGDREGAAIEPDKMTAEDVTDVVKGTLSPEELAAMLKPVQNAAAGGGSNLMMIALPVAGYFLKGGLGVGVGLAIGFMLGKKK